MFAVRIHGRGGQGAVTAAELHLDKAKKYTVRDLWEHADAKGDGAIQVKLAPHATAIYRISAL